MNKITKTIISLMIAAAMIVSLVISINAVTLYSQDGFYFSRATTTTAALYGRYSDDADVVIPKDFSEYYVSEIVDSAFENDQKMISLDLTSAILLERIGYYAFQNCSALSGNVIFSGRISTLGESAFKGCSSLESVQFYSKNLKRIPAYCFYDCISLSDVLLNDRITEIGDYAFSGCGSLSEIVIPASVTSISPTAFSGDDDLVIYCYYDSYAALYAEENGIEYVILNPPSPPTEAPTDPPTEEPTDEPTDEPTTAPTTYLLGDADQDGYVTVLDATTIQRFLAFLISDDTGFIQLAGNVDGDNKLSVLDATGIQKYLAQIPVPYPIEKVMTI